MHTGLVLSLATITSTLRMLNLGWLLCLLVWLVAFVLKLLTTVTLLGFACGRTEKNAREMCRSSQGGEKPFLEGIGRFTLHGKRIM